MATKEASTVTITPLPSKKSIQSIRLDFLVSNRSESISIEISAKGAERLATGVLQVLRSGNSPVPPSPVPSGGRQKPKLRIVK